MTTDGLGITFAVKRSMEPRDKHPQLSAAIDSILFKPDTHANMRKAIIAAVEKWMTTHEGMSAAVMVGYEQGLADGKRERA
jgi:hypothetical protein